MGRFVVGNFDLGGEDEGHQIIWFSAARASGPAAAHAVRLRRQGMYGVL